MKIFSGRFPEDLFNDENYNEQRFLDLKDEKEFRLKEKDIFDNQKNTSVTIRFLITIIGFIVLTISLFFNFDFKTILVISLLIVTLFWFLDSICNAMYNAKYYYLSSEFKIRDLNNQMDAEIAKINKDKKDE